VVARFRPQNKIEIASGGEPIVDFKSEDTCSINVRTRFQKDRPARAYGEPSG
jgi:hypothetical protein